MRLLARPALLCAPLTIPCPDCEDGVRWVSRYVTGNSPDGDMTPCIYCHGTGEVGLGCDNCRADATEWVEGRPFCARCAAEEKENAFSVVEDA